MTLVEQLERLSALHENGALSDTEFASAKQQLLSPTPTAAATAAEEPRAAAAAVAAAMEESDGATGAPPPPPTAGATAPPHVRCCQNFPCAPTPNTCAALTAPVWGAPGSRQYRRGQQARGVRRGAPTGSARSSGATACAQGHAQR
jgi:hypothetical protein